MKRLFLLLLLISVSSISYSQNNTIFKQDFESLEKGSEINKIPKKKLTVWGQSVWKVKENKGKGFGESNKFLASGKKENSTLVRFEKLEPGATYEFSVAVKVTSTDDAKWKRNYTVKATSGKKGDVHIYSEEKMKDVVQGKWRHHKQTFKVIQGRENVTLQIFRWAADVVVHVDDFKLVRLD